MSLSRRAFTLVELLVVVTIIVILIALLAPAIDKAIYQAELAVCGSKQHAIGLGVTQYAGEYKRWYPYRKAVHDQVAQMWPMNVSLGQAQYDDRAKLQQYFALNKALNCPLIPGIDIEGSRSDTYVFGTENYWFGFKFRGVGAGDGMFRLGGRLEFTDSGAGFWGKGVSSKYSEPLLTSTRYVFTGAQVQTSHPDDNHTAWVTKLQDTFQGTAEVAGIGVNGQRYTYVRWDAADPNYGRVDLNACFADLAVRRYDKIQWNPWDDRPARVPSFTNAGSFPGSWEAVPKE